MDEADTRTAAKRTGMEPGDGPIMTDQEKAILAHARNLAVILPMSGRTSPSTIAGIPCVGEARAAFRSSGAPQASLCMSS